MNCLESKGQLKYDKRKEKSHKSKENLESEGLIFAVELSLC